MEQNKLLVLFFKKPYYVATFQDKKYDIVTHSKKQLNKLNETWEDNILQSNFICRWNKIQEKNLSLCRFSACIFQMTDRTILCNDRNSSCWNVTVYDCFLQQYQKWAKKKCHTLHNEIKFLYLLSTTLCMREMGHSNIEHKRK